MSWNIITFESKRGEKSVDELILKQQPHTIAKIAHTIKLLEKYGNKLGMPHSKALGIGLYELRIRGKEEIRIFYSFTSQKTIYLLHGFKKQTQQTPKKELEVAIERLNGLKET